MTEFRHRANRRPTRAGVAIFAGNIQRAMRAAARQLLRVRGTHKSQRQ
jgi:hypothetical protein